MDNDNKPDNLKDMLLLMCQVLDKERQINLCLHALDLMEEQVKQKQKEIRNEEFNRQIKAAAAAKLYTC